MSPQILRSKLLWILVLGGALLALIALWLVVALPRAERKARRAFFQSLGLDEQAIALLTMRNEDLGAELNRLRQAGSKDAPSARADAELRSAVSKTPIDYHPPRQGLRAPAVANLKPARSREEATIARATCRAAGAKAVINQGRRSSKPRY